MANSVVNGLGKTKLSARKLTMIGMLAAVSTVLAFIDFSVPLFPPFLKFDLSDLPVLLSSFMFGPISGIAVALVKNLIGCFSSSTAGVGELSNLLIASALSVGAGLFYKTHKTRKGALIGIIIGVVAMAVVAGFSNYFLIIPAYAKVMPIDKIIEMCQAVNPAIDSVMGYVLFGAVPFTLLKGLACGLVTFLVYKKLHAVILKIVR